MEEPTALRFLATKSRGEVSALWQCPKQATAAYVFAHGAGAGMHHGFMVDLSQRLADRGVATFRFQFPYTEAGRRRPDFAPILHATVCSAVAQASTLAGGLPLFAGGKSMGGRMTSMAAADGKLGRVQGIIFVGFPLHPAGKLGTERADHLHEVPQPLLFIQGTRDKLCELDRMHGVVQGLRDAATLRVIEGGDHSFAVLKRSGRDPNEVMDEVANAISEWIAGQR